jgi:predicted ABC-type ATPase
LRPTVFVLAGPNGSGKTTFAMGDPDLRGLEFINTDQKAAALAGKIPGSAEIAAGMNVLRVATRVAKGGHNVPEVDIRRRYERSLSNLARALPLADRARLVDNSETGAARLIATFELGAQTWRGEQPPGWAACFLTNPAGAA